jgi:hypothetical protein
MVKIKNIFKRKKKKANSNPQVFEREETVSLAQASHSTHGISADNSGLDSSPTRSGSGSGTTGSGSVITGYYSSSDKTSWETEASSDSHLLERSQNPHSISPTAVDTSCDLPEVFDTMTEVASVASLQFEKTRHNIAENISKTGKNLDEAKVRTNAHLRTFSDSLLTFLDMKHEDDVDFKPGVASACIPGNGVAETVASRMARHKKDWKKLSCTPLNLNKVVPGRNATDINTTNEDDQYDVTFNDVIVYDERSPTSSIATGITEPEHVLRNIVLSENLAPFSPKVKDLDLTLKAKKNIVSTPRAVRKSPKVENPLNRETFNVEKELDIDAKLNNGKDDMVVKSDDHRILFIPPPPPPPNPRARARNRIQNTENQISDNLIPSSPIVNRNYVAPSPKVDENAGASKTTCEPKEEEVEPNGNLRKPARKSSKKKKSRKTLSRDDINELVACVIQQSSSESFAIPKQKPYSAKKNELGKQIGVIQSPLKAVLPEKTSDEHDLKNNPKSKSIRVFNDERNLAKDVAKKKLEHAQQEIEYLKQLLEDKDRRDDKEAMRTIIEETGIREDLSNEEVYEENPPERLAEQSLYIALDNNEEDTPGENLDEDIPMITSANRRSRGRSRGERPRDDSQEDPNFVSTPTTTNRVTRTPSASPSLSIKSLVTPTLRKNKNDTPRVHVPTRSPAPMLSDMTTAANNAYPEPSSPKVLQINSNFEWGSFVTEGDESNMEEVSLLPNKAFERTNENDTPRVHVPTRSPAPLLSYTTSAANNAYSEPSSPKKLHINSNFEWGSFVAEEDENDMDEVCLLSNEQVSSPRRYGRGLRSPKLLG